MRMLRRRQRLPEPMPLGYPALSAEQVSVNLGTAKILDGVSLTAHTGELLALVGPNGAGKSTLLAALAGDVSSYGGVIRLTGEELSHWSDTEAAMRRAVLLQRITLTFPFTVREVVAMGRSPWLGTPREVDDDRVIAETMALTDTAQFADRVFRSLSGGEQARVALARVLAQEASVLLLDEPTAALDLRHQELVLALARDRARDGEAVVVVLHDLNLAAAYADRVAVLDRGRIAAVGAPDDVLEPELLARVYRHPVEVLPHPRTQAPIILARR